ncbi:Major Facilitator Superfamily [Aspergillus sclerotialis]|uniref:Major Facilitator Superfamily n=1 Tax=Aspergillus sclerotialis TaxID=2070753 RepID=A0A3A2ZSH9_9EURO|nr:Major Facilitator Superfamily [Aspergillus sclerotialis]
MTDIASEKHNRKSDDGASFTHGHVKEIENQETPHFSAAAERRLVWKIDLMILPLMLLAYMLAFLDKQGLNTTAIMGIKEELHLSGSDYSWSNAIFYFGYLFFSYPASILLVKFPLGKYLSTTFMIWAVILACHAATTNFAGLMVVRFLLGLFEASLSPGFSLITSLWYRTSEQPLRHGLWFLGNSISFIIGNIISVGIWEIKSSLANWKWVFIIFGIITFVWGALMLWRLPDSPMTTKILTEEERIIAIERLKSNKAGYKSNKLNVGQIFEAFIDYKTWMLAIYVIGTCIPNGGLTAFSSQVLKGFGYSTYRTLLLGMPPGAVMFAGVLLSTAISSKFKNTRCIMSAIMTVISLVGCVLVYATKAIQPRYAGLNLVGLFSVGLPLTMSMISSNVGGFTKRATVSSIIFICYCAGNIIGPQLFFQDEAPKYQSGFLAMIICLVVATIDILLLGVLLFWENKRRDRKAALSGVEERQDTELADITDFQNKDFRYVF